MSKMNADDFERLAKGAHLILNLLKKDDNRHNALDKLKGLSQEQRDKIEKAIGHTKVQNLSKCFDQSGNPIPEELANARRKFTKNCHYAYLEAFNGVHERPKAIQKGIIPAHAGPLAIEDGSIDESYPSGLSDHEASISEASSHSSQPVGATSLRAQQSNTKRPAFPGLADVITNLDPAEGSVSHTESAASEQRASQVLELDALELGDDLPSPRLPDSIEEGEKRSPRLPGSSDSENDSRSRAVLILNDVASNIPGFPDSLEDKRKPRDIIKDDIPQKVRRLADSSAGSSSLILLALPLSLVIYFIFKRRSKRSKHDEVIPMHSEESKTA